MTTTNRLLYGVNVAAGLALAVVVAVLLSPLAGAVSLAAPLVALGTGVTGDSVMTDASGRVIPSVSEIIDEYDPLLTPLTSWLNMFGGLNNDPRLSNPTSVEFEILERSRFQRFAQIDGVTTAGSAGAAKTVTVNSGHMIVPGSIMKSFTNATDDSFDYIVTATTATTLTIKALPQVSANTRGLWTSAVAFGTVPAFADNEYLQWVGTAKSERDAASQAIRLEPTPVTQFIQTLDGTASLSDHAQRIQVYGSPSLWDDATKQAVEEFRKTREAAYCLQGEKSVTSDTNLNSETEKTWKMRGARGSLTSVVSLPTAPTISDIIAFNYSLHAGHEGFTTKLLVAGAGITERLDKAAATSDIIRSDMFIEEIGAKVTRIFGTKGNTDVVYSPIFDEYGLEDEGKCFDMRYAGRAVMQEVEERDIDQKNSGKGVDGDLRQYISKEALVLHKCTGSRAVHHRVDIA